MILKSKKCVFSFFLIAGLFLFSVILDFGLGLLGFPSQVPIRISEPPNAEWRVNNIEFSYTVKTNAEGLRYREVPKTKKENEFRVAVLGDSFVEGFGVEGEQTFSALLEDQWTQAQKKTSFINMGLGGKGPLQYGRVLSHYGFDYKPDLVLICIYANDLVDTIVGLDREVIHVNYQPKRYGIRGLLHSLWPRIYVLSKRAKGSIAVKKNSNKDFVEMMKGLSKRKGVSRQDFESWKQRIPKEWIQAANENRINEALLAYGLTKTEYWVESLDLSTENAEGKWNSLKNILAEMVTQIRKREIEVGFVYIPVNLQYDARYFDNSVPNIWKASGVEVRQEWLEGQSEFEKRLEKWFQLKRVPYLNLTPVFREEVKASKDLNYLIDGHWTAKGHAVAARAIGEWLKKEGLLNL